MTTYAVEHMIYNPITPKKQLDSYRDTLFDIIRSLCVLEIVGYYHMFNYISYESYELGRGITIGVLASFTFMSSYFLGQKKILDIKNFYKKRFKRFYIPFFISLSILFSIGLISSGRVYILSILGLSGLFPPMPLTLWYIDMLIIFYFLTPWLQLFGNHKLVYIKHITCGVIFLFLAIFCGADNRMAIYFPFFSLGLLWGPQLVRLVLSKKNSIFIISCLIEVLLIFYCNNTDNTLETIGFNLSVGFFGLLIIMIISNFINKTCGKSIQSVFKWISYSSMMAYMYHRQIYRILTICFPSKMFPIWFIPIALVLVFTIAYYLQRAYDSIIRYYSDEKKSIV